MLSPLIIGKVAEMKGMSFGLGVTVVFNLIGLLALTMLPETAEAVVSGDRHG